MENAAQLSLYRAEQIASLLETQPSIKLVGLKIQQDGDYTALHAIFIEQVVSEAEQLPCRALVTVADWDGQRAQHHRHRYD